MAGKMHYIRSLPNSSALQIMTSQRLQNMFRKNKKAQQSLLPEHISIPSFGLGDLNGMY